MCHCQPRAALAAAAAAFVFWIFCRPLSRSILLRDHPLRTHCHKVLPLDCLLTPLPSPPSWDPLNCLETGTLEASGPSPREDSGFIEGSRSFWSEFRDSSGGSWRGVEGGDCGTGRLNGKATQSACQCRRGGPRAPLHGSASPPYGSR